MGLEDLYRNTKVMDLFRGSPVSAQSFKGATIDVATVGINESLLAIAIRGSSWQGGQVGAQPPAGEAGTLTMRFLQNIGTNASSWIHVPGSTMIMPAKGTIRATPIYATQRYIRATFRVQMGGATYLNFSAVVVGTGRHILPLSTK